MPTRQAMIPWLMDDRVVKKRYPPPVLSPAFLHEMVGEKEKACEIILAFQPRVLGTWREKATEVAKRFGCTG